MNRGSDSSAMRPESAMRGFNEAPIHESGKLARGQSDRRTCDRFNEAPIHESGKLYH